MLVQHLIITFKLFQQIYISSVDQHHKHLGRHVSAFHVENDVMKYRFDNSITDMYIIIFF